MLTNKQTSGFLKGMKVGIPASFVFEEYPSKLLETWSRSAEWLHQHGAEIVDVAETELSLDLVQLALPSYYVLVSAEASSNLSRYDGFRYGVAASSSCENATRSEDESNNLEFTPLERQYAASRSAGFGDEVARRILCGTSVLSSDRFHSHYEAAAKIRAALADELTTLLDKKVDTLLIPTVATIEPHLIEPGKEIDNTAVLATDVLTVPASLGGLPAVSVPVHHGSSDPFRAGMQLIGARLREDVVLRAAKVLELMDDKTE